MEDSRFSKKYLSLKAPKEAKYGDGWPMPLLAFSTSLPSSSSLTAMVGGHCKHQSSHLGEKPRHSSTLFWPFWRKEVRGRPYRGKICFQAWQVVYHSKFNIDDEILTDMIEYTWSGKQQRKELPSEPLVTFSLSGRYYFDNNPLVGKLAGLAAWSSLLSENQMRTRTSCSSPVFEQGNLLSGEYIWCCIKVV